MLVKSIMFAAVSESPSKDSAKPCIIVAAGQLPRTNAAARTSGSTGKSINMPRIIRGKKNSFEIAL